jgi:NADPH2:quinone reductase
MPVSATLMRALVFDAPAPDTSTSHVTQIPVPEPGPGEVTINVAYAGVNFKDVMARRGDPGYVPSWPFVPGLEVSGTIRAIGSGAPDWRVGQRVAAFTDAGGLAEVATARAELLVGVPDGLDLELAAAAPGALTTAALLLTDIGHLSPGETVLVHSAAGGVGQAVSRLAHLGGARVVIGTVGDAGRVAASQQAGYDAVFVRGPGLASTIRDYTAGRGVDLILDPQGTTQLDLDLELAAPAARIVIFGNAAGQPLAALPPLSRLLSTNVSIAGFSLGALAGNAPERLAAALRTVLEQLATGQLDTEVTSIDGLAAAPNAQQALAESQGRGKQIVRVAATAH